MNDYYTPTRKEMQMTHYHTVLTIAGSDSGGGAGIQADIKTISALGCFATSAITAVTVQNTLGVQDIHPVPVPIVEGQIRAVLDDIGADAVKIGMLQSEEIVLTIARTLHHYAVKHIVLDPVMVSTSGHRLIEENAMQALCQQLIPMARIITPNIPEAEWLLGGRKLSGQASLPEAARELSETFGVSVLLKAGHLEEDCLVDYFCDASHHDIIPLPSARIPTRNTHGTGCTMSSALAALLAKGLTLEEAARGAKRFIEQAIRSGAGYEIGHGHGPVNHFFSPLTPE